VTSAVSIAHSTSLIWRLECLAGARRPQPALLGLTFRAKLCREALLEQQIVAFLIQDESVGTVLAKFADRDETTVQAALFQLLADGRVTSPDLAIGPMGAATRFHRMPVVLASKPS
jgi:hypothetical protein